MHTAHSVSRDVVRTIAVAGLLGDGHHTLGEAGGVILSFMGALAPLFLLFSGRSDCTHLLPLTDLLGPVKMAAGNGPMRLFSTPDLEDLNRWLYVGKSADRDNLSRPVCGSAPLR